MKKNQTNKLLKHSKNQGTEDSFCLQLQASSGSTMPPQTLQAIDFLKGSSQCLFWFFSLPIYFVFSLPSLKNKTHNSIKKKVLEIVFTRSVPGKLLPLHYVASAQSHQAGVYFGGFYCFSYHGTLLNGRMSFTLASFRFQ